MDFGDALRALKSGQRIAREGWNGKGMWLSLSGGLTGQYVAAEHFWSLHNAKAAEQQGGFAHVLPAITMKNAKDQIVLGWLASQEDMLSEDWVVLED